MLPTREYNMISSSCYDNLDKAKKKATLKMTGEDIQEKVFDEYLSLEELDKELAKLEDLAMFGWGSYEHKNK